VAHPGRLTFDGVTELSLHDAELLSESKGDIGLNAVESLAPQIAEVLAHSTLTGLELVSLNSADEQVRSILSQFKGERSLPEVREEKVVTKAIAEQVRSNRFQRLHVNRGGSRPRVGCP